MNQNNNSQKVGNPNRTIITNQGNKLTIIMRYKLIHSAPLPEKKDKIN